jgi:FixJ family two-component response regulator
MKAVIGVVDDDPSILRAVSRLLDAAGLTVETFGSAEEFLALEHPERIACLLLDIRMNGLSGFDLHERLAESQISIPIIFITAHDDAATHERVQKAGAAAYLRKPFDERALLEAIEGALGRD